MIYDLYYLDRGLLRRRHQLHLLQGALHERRDAGTSVEICCHVVSLYYFGDFMFIGVCVLLIYALTLVVVIAFAPRHRDLRGAKKHPPRGARALTNR